MAYYLKDRALLAFATILFFLYSLQIYEQGDLPLLLVVFIPLIYYINHHGMHQCKLIFFMNSLLLLHFLHSGMWYAGMNQWFIVVVLFTAGIIASRIPLATYKESMVIVGHVVHGIYGIVLTMPFIWERLFSEGTSQVLALIFAVAYGIYIILLIREGKLLPIAILCGLIFRFYIDISYDFLPKSLFFIIGGFLLIAFGIWFERSRRGEAKS